MFRDVIKSVRFATVVAIAAAPLLWASQAAADPSKDVAPSSDGARDVRNEIPIVAYTYSATGASAHTFGVQAYGVGVVGPTGSYAAPAPPANPPAVGGGVTMWYAPIDRLTLIGDAGRDLFGNFAPSGTVVVRLLGRADDGFSLGALGKYKVEGFSGGPLRNEIEGEIETGILGSYVRRGFHVDVNGIGGMGTGDDGEADVEGRLRVGYNVLPYLRLGADSQARFRVAGTNKLVGDRTWDFAAGPQALLTSKNFFGALTAGPTTMNIARSVGWTAMVTVGGVSF